MTSLKRPSDSLDQGSNKKPKVHPFFTKSPSTFKWLPKIDNSCWTGVNSDFEYRTKVAIFDIDGTLLKSPAGGHPVAPHLWEWWNEAVPAKLKELYSLGFAIILVTNQGSTRHIKNLEEKLPKVASKIPDLPFLVYAAPNKDQFRKPRIGTFHISASFFVGDAAGRQRPQNSDHSDCDIKYAANIGIQFYTPEEYFLGLPKPTNIVLKGFHPLHTPIPVNYSLCWLSSSRED
ncbi:polynucleotide kinase 3 phosphatase-domain-containing protein [Flagelloscypha sp. PMI_526]|nr:polynucleotide kinase 3 phosphatase-domain-containing protein [Flagelloscypha sp. PMI_526]